MEIKSIFLSKSKYLDRLSYLKKPPEKLYYYGKIPEYNGVSELNSRFPAEGVGRPKTVAIVGARKMTAYGEAWAFRFAKELAELGVIVVSGLATGVDAAAHRGALAAKGCTIAFLGTPIDKVYPAENQRLFEEILAQGGCVLSELCAGAEYHPRTTF